LYQGITPTKFGYEPAADAFRAGRLHLHSGGTLATVDHEPPLPVLDQEDLIAQGIDTSRLVPGAQRVDALGSCTCQAGTVSLGERYAAVRGATSLAGIGLSATDSQRDEEYAIVLYHQVTDQTGSPASEWPPTDCGSSGLFVCHELEARGLIAGHKTAGDITSLVSLLQGGTVIMGLPWFRSWMTPDAGGFVDGQGGVMDLERSIASGVAGGHETCISAVERLSFTGSGEVDPFGSHVRVRNSWSEAWGDHGSYRIHLSTLAMLGRYADFRQLIVTEA
jgi:hypothetical protein